MKCTKIYRLLAGGALLALAGGYAGAQTQVDLRTQAKSVDFSAAPSTKAFQAGVFPPGSCSVGQTFFKTNAPAGANFYACTSANTWTLASGNATQIQSRNIASTAPADGQALVWDSFASAWQPGLAGAAPTNLEGLSDCQVVHTSATRLTVNGAATPSTPCNVKVGGKVYAFNSSATIDITAGAGAVLIYLNYASGSAQLEVAYNGPTISCSGMNCVRVNSSSYPAAGKYVPLHEWLATVPGTWDAGNGIPRRAFLGDFSVNGGSGISITQASDGTQNVAVDTTVARTGQPFVVEGTNAYMGVALLTAGTATVSTTAVAANSRIFLTLQDCTANAGTPYVSARAAGVSFVISNTNPDNACSVAWLILSPQ